MNALKRFTLFSVNSLNFVSKQNGLVHIRTFSQCYHQSFNPSSVGPVFSAPLQISGRFYSSSSKTPVSTKTAPSNPLQSRLSALRYYIYIIILYIIMFSFSISFFLAVFVNKQILKYYKEWTCWPLSDLPHNSIKISSLIPYIYFIMTFVPVYKFGTPLPLLLFFLLLFRVWLG